MTIDPVDLNGAHASLLRGRLANGLHGLQSQLVSHKTLHRKLVDCFMNSATSLLSALAAALFFRNIACANLVAAREPLFTLPISALCWCLGLGAFAVALACVYMRQSRFKLTLILWFAATIGVYRLGLQWLGIHSLRGYTAALAHTFSHSDGLVITLLNVLFSYLIMGSAALLLWDWLAGPEEAQLKAICIHCGGHIAFSAQNLGQKISCPHCLKETTLHKPGLIRMTCYFCQGHIEFPSHAIGEKIHCPHCKNDITMKGP